jgi:hypothetical protein
MEHVAENFQNIVLEDLKEHPELITEILCNDQDVSLILEKRGHTVRYAYLRIYDQESRRILEEAKTEYLQKKQQGYSREQAFKDLLAVEEEITTQLASHKR